MNSPNEEWFCRWVEDELAGPECAAVDAWAVAHPEWIACRDDARWSKSLLRSALPAAEEPRGKEFFNARIARQIALVMKTNIPLILVVLLAGCTVGPNYQKNSLSDSGAPVGWHAKVAHQGKVSGISQWWRRFDDPALTRLIENAERNSPTLEASLALISKARASVKSSRGDLFPSLYGTGSAGRSNGQTGGTTQAGGGAISNTGSAGLDASWEVDLFGGNRRNIQASQARLEGAEADWNDARVTLAAEVANAYATARTYQARIALYEDELKSRQATEELTRLKVEAGTSPTSEALQIRASTASAAGNLENERGNYEQALNQLVMLTALSYESVQSTLGGSKAGTIPSMKRPTSLGIPAAVLAQRPDVRSAERTVAAASADIGVAIADALPSLTLGGSIGVNSSRSSSTNVSARTWSFGPDLSIPLFTGGKVTANIESSRAEYQRTVANFRSEVLIAVQETEDALVQVDAASRRIGHAREAAMRYQEFFNAQEESYKAGRGTLLDLEDARRLSLSSQESLLDVQLSQTQGWIALYKAAGGGW